MNVNSCARAWFLGNLLVVLNACGCKVELPAETSSNGYGWGRDLDVFPAVIDMGNVSIGSVYPVSFEVCSRSRPQVAGVPPVMVIDVSRIPNYESDAIVWLVECQVVWAEVPGSHMPVVVHGTNGKEFTVEIVGRSKPSIFVVDDKSLFFGKIARKMRGLAEVRIRGMALAKIETIEKEWLLLPKEWYSWASVSLRRGKDGDVVLRAELNRGLPAGKYEGVIRLSLEGRRLLEIPVVAIKD